MVKITQPQSVRQQVIGKVIVGSLLGLALGAAVARSLATVFAIEDNVALLYGVTISVFSVGGSLAGFATGHRGRLVSGGLFGAMCGALAGSLIAWAWGQATVYVDRLWLTPAGLLAGVVLGGCAGALAGALSRLPDKSPRGN